MLTSEIDVEVGMAKRFSRDMMGYSGVHAGLAVSPFADVPCPCFLFTLFLSVIVSFWGQVEISVLKPLSLSVSLSLSLSLSLSFTLSPSPFPHVCACAWALACVCACARVNVYICLSVWSSMSRGWHIDLGFQHRVVSQQVCKCHASDAKLICLSFAHAPV
jgi:hypothetical protein